MPSWNYSSIPAAKWPFADDVSRPPITWFCDSCGREITACKCPLADAGSARYKWGSGNTYYQGQADVLAWLDGDLGVDENPMAPICTTLTAEYACWCLGHNLTIVCALKVAELKGKEAATKWNRGYNRYGYNVY